MPQRAYDADRMFGKLRLRASVGKLLGWQPTCLAKASVTKTAKITDRQPGLRGLLRHVWLKNFLRVIPYQYRSPGGFTIPCQRRYEMTICQAMFEADNYRLREIARPVHTVLDVGANFGAFTFAAADFFSSEVKHIVAVEPFAVNHRRIQSVSRDNGLGHKVTAVNAAVSDQPGHGELRLSQGAHYGHSLEVRKNPIAKGLQPVELTTLDVLRQRFGLGRIDLLKLDVEGSELAALDGGMETLRVTRTLIIEAHKGFCGLRDLQPRLRPLGFVLKTDGLSAGAEHGDFTFVQTAWSDA